MAAILIGVLATFPSYYLLLWRARSSLDDSLDVFSAHGVGGISGSLLTGLFASTVWGAAVDGGIRQLGIQALAIAAALAFSGAGTFIVAKLVGFLVPLRANKAAEAQGLDVPMHGEEAYTDGEGAILIPVTSSPAAARVITQPAGGKA
jgi:Amt family ammonium transporter